MPDTNQRTSVTFFARHSPRYSNFSGRSFFLIAESSGKSRGAPHAATWHGGARWAKGPVAAGLLSSSRATSAPPAQITPTTTSTRLMESVTALEQAKRNAPEPRDSTQHGDNNRT